MDSTLSPFLNLDLLIEGHDPIRTYNFPILVRAFVEFYLILFHVIEPKYSKDILPDVFLRYCGFS